MNYQELADSIAERYTPFAMECGCKGSNPECQTALEDPAVWGQYNTTIRIVEYIRSLSK